MNYLIEKETDTEFDFDITSLIKEVGEVTADYFNLSEKLSDTEVSVLLTGKDEIKEINKEYRNIDKETDVLSFPMYEFEVPGSFTDAESGENILGDIVICIPKAIEQAKDFGHSEKREIAFLFLHGLLHILGFDHIEDDDRLLMESKQDDILNLIGIKR